MQTKKRRIRNSWYGNKQPRVKKVRKKFRTLTSDVRPIVIIGKDASGKVVATDRTDSHWKAQQIAAAWKGSGWEVEVTAGDDL